MKDNISVEEKYKSITEILSQEEANKYFEECVKHTMGMSYPVVAIGREEAESIERKNIGRFASSFNNEIRLRVEKLFKAVDPVNGRVIIYEDQES